VRISLIDRIRAKVRSGLAGMTFLLALGGGCLAALSMLGGVLNKIASIGPWWTPAVLFAVTVMICIGDWAIKSVGGAANRWSMYTAMVFPSFFIASLTGESGAKLFSAIGAISKDTANDWKSGVKDWTDLPGNLENAFTVFSLICIVAAITYAQRYVKQDREGAAQGGGMPVMSGRNGR